MIKKLFAFALVSLLAFSLTACSTNTAKGPVNISLTLWDEVQAPIIQKNIDRFNTLNEGKIKATIELVPWSNYWQKLDASLGSAASADVMWMNVYLPKYVDGKVVKALDEFIKKDKLDLTQYVTARVDAFKYKNQQYSLPKGLDAVFVAYNKEIFDKYGVDYPKEGWSWDDMRAAATKLRDAIAAKSGKEYPIAMELDGQPSYINFIQQNGSAYLSADGKTTNIGDAKAIDAIQQVVNLMSDKLMAPYTVLSETKGTDMFVSGQAGIVFIGSWKASVLNESSLGKTGKIGLVQMPKMASSNTSVLGGLGYAMSANTKNPNQAWALIKFLTSEESETFEAKNGIDFPANIKAQAEYVKSFPNINGQVIANATLTGFPYPSNGNFEWTTFVDDAITLALSGKAPVAETLKAGALKAQAVLDKLNK